MRRFISGHHSRPCPWARVPRRTRFKSFPVPRGRRTRFICLRRFCQMKQDLYPDSSHTDHLNIIHVFHWSTSWVLYESSIWLQNLRICTCLWFSLILIACSLSSNFFVMSGWIVFASSCIISCNSYVCLEIRCGSIGTWIRYFRTSGSLIRCLTLRL